MKAEYHAQPPKPLTARQRKERLLRDRLKAIELIRKNPHIEPWRLAAELEGTPVMSPSGSPRHPRRASGWEQMCYVTHRVLEPIGIYYGTTHWRGQGLPDPEHCKLCWREERYEG
jgi:hypothetical protein